MNAENFIPVKNVFNAVIGGMNLQNFDRFIIAGKTNTYRTYIGYLLLAKLFSEFNQAFEVDPGSALIIDPSVFSSELINLLNNSDTNLTTLGSIAHFPFEISDHRKLTEGYRSKIFTFGMAELSSLTTLNEDLEYVFASIAQLKAIAIVPVYSSFLRQDPKQSLDALVSKIKFSSEENTLLIHPVVDSERNLTIEVYQMLSEAMKQDMGVSKEESQVSMD